MSREFSKVSPAIWRSRRFRNLESDARLAHVYFLTCDHQSSAGCFRLPDAYAAADLGWEVQRYRAALEQVVTAGLIAHDEATEEVFVKGWFRFSAPQNDKHAQGTERLISNIESETLRAIVEAEFDEANRLRRLAAQKGRAVAQDRYP